MIVKKIFLSFLVFLQCFMTFGQSSNDEGVNELYRNLGLAYFGELGFRPGLEIDYGILLKLNENQNDRKRFLRKLLYLRPAIAYYHYPNYSNNFQFAAKLNYQLITVNKLSQRYLSLEPFVKIAYLRYSFIGEIYETTTTGFEERNFAGSNSVSLGGGVDFGGYLTKRFDWIFGADYYAERTADKLILHRFVAKLGLRYKIQSQ